MMTAYGYRRHTMRIYDAIAQLHFLPKHSSSPSMSMNLNTFRMCFVYITWYVCVWLNQFGRVHFGNDPTFVTNHYQYAYIKLTRMPCRSVTDWLLYLFSIRRNTCIVWMLGDSFSSTSYDVCTKNCKLNVLKCSSVGSNIQCYENKFHVSRNTHPQVSSNMHASVGGESARISFLTNYALFRYEKMYLRCADVGPHPAERVPARA